MNDRNYGPLISVVVPVYGTEEYFTRCMDSLLEQTYPDLEILVVNDGSKGDIRERIKKYTAPVSNSGSGPIVRFIDFAENAGLLRARVLGAREASGEFIAFAEGQFGKKAKTDISIIIMTVRSCLMNWSERMFRRHSSHRSSRIIPGIRSGTSCIGRACGICACPNMRRSKSTS